MFFRLIRADHMHRSLLLALAVLLLSGCAHQQASPLEIEEAKLPLMCSGRDQCDLFWRRAQAWIGINSKMKIQIANESVVETFNPTSNEPVWAFRLVREPRDGSSERINIAVACGNPFGCHEPRERVVMNFKRYVRGEGF
jgi:hypothetical protein